MHHCIAATEDQRFSIDGEEFDIRKGEAFVAINCFKFPLEWFQRMAWDAGFEIDDPIIDNEGRMVIQPLAA